MRELAAQLVINPNTIQRAYRELESEGYIRSVTGKGSFACEKNCIDDGRVRELFKVFDDTVTELLFLGRSPEELRGRIDGKGDAQT